MEKEPITYNTLRMVSKPIYFLGLPPLYLVGVALIVMLGSFFMIMKIGMVGIVLVIPLIVVVVALLGKLSKEQKKGCPDILSSFIVKFATKERYSDQSFLLKYLRK